MPQILIITFWICFQSLHSKAADDMDVLPELHIFIRGLSLSTINQLILVKTGIEH